MGKNIPIFEEFIPPSDGRELLQKLAKDANFVFRSLEMAAYVHGFEGVLPPREEIVEEARGALTLDVAKRNFFLPLTGEGRKAYLRAGFSAAQRLFRKMSKESKIEVDGFSSTPCDEWEVADFPAIADKWLSAIHAWESVTNSRRRRSLVQKWTGWIMDGVEETPRMRDLRAFRSALLGGLTSQGHSAGMAENMLPRMRETRGRK